MHNQCSETVPRHSATMDTQDVEELPQNQHKQCSTHLSISTLNQKCIILHVAHQASGQYPTHDNVHITYGTQRLSLYIIGVFGKRLEGWDMRAKPIMNVTVISDR